MLRERTSVADGYGEAYDGDAWTSVSNGIASVIYVSWCAYLLWTIVSLWPY